jgi:hypothetical protein
MNSYVIYNPQHQVVICKAHECAISLKTAISHFREEHNIPLEKRQEIFNYISTKVVVEADQLEYSLNRVTPIPYLKIVNAYQCQYESCCLILSTLESIKKHCRQEHLWKAKDGIR